MWAQILRKYSYMKSMKSNEKYFVRSFAVGLIGFSKTSYTVMEGKSETICVGLNNENNIAPDVSITYTLKINMSDAAQGQCNILLIFLQV